MPPFGNLGGLGSGKGLLGSVLVLVLVPAETETLLSRLPFTYARTALPS